MNQIIPAVIGLGYVGLPIFLRLNKRFNTLGFDINLKNTMDYQMILEFGINEGQKSFLRIPHVLGGFRRYDGQKTGSHLERVIKEHKAIAKRYKYTDKYNMIGKTKYFLYRFRRAWWYFKRGGLSNLIYRLKIAYDNRF